MNRLTKGLLGVGALLLLSGGLLALSGWTMGGQTELDLSWNGHGVRIGPLGIVSRDSAAQTETAARDGREELHLQAFRRVDVDVDLGDVTVTQGGDYGVSLNWKGKHYALEYELDGDTLRVRSSAQGGRFGLDGYGGTVTVYVPQHLRLEQLEVRSDLGDICLEGIAADTATVTGDLGDLTLGQGRAGALELHESMGTIDGAGLTVERSLSVENDMGDVRLEGDLQGELEVADSMGEIELTLSGPVEDYRYELNVDMGEICVNGETYRSEASRSGGRHSLNVENSMGDISVTFG